MKPALPDATRWIDAAIVLFGALPPFLWLNDAPDLALAASFLMPAGIILSSLMENSLNGNDPLDRQPR
jgi:hypothetical protein